MKALLKTILAAALATACALPASPAGAQALPPIPRFMEVKPSPLEALRLAPKPQLDPACEASPTRACLLEYLHAVVLAGSDPNLPIQAVASALRHDRLDLALSLAPRLRANNAQGNWTRLIQALIRAGRDVEADRVIALSGYPRAAFDTAVATALVEIGRVGEAERLLQNRAVSLAVDEATAALAAGHAFAGRVAEARALVEAVPNPEDREAARLEAMRLMLGAWPGSARRSHVTAFASDFTDAAAGLMSLTAMEARTVDLASIKEPTQRDGAAWMVAAALAREDGKAALAAALQCTSYARVIALAGVAGWSGEGAAFAALEQAVARTGGLNARSNRALVAQALVLAGRDADAERLLGGAPGAHERRLTLQSMAIAHAQRGRAAAALRFMRQEGDESARAWLLREIVDNLPG